jgi:perosamine synthetase
MKNNFSNKLALFGGKPVLSKKLPVYNTIGSEEKRAVMKVLDSGELSGFVASNGDNFYGGREVKNLEKKFSNYFSVPYSVSSNSATSSLHSAVLALGVSPGDQVIVPPYTMSASATCVLFAGGTPVFCDIDDQIFCIDPKSVESLINKSTKGIVAVNLFGHPAKLKELRKIADKYKIFLLEDNSQAPGAKIGNKFAGTIGDVGVFSFNRHKTMQSGEGGMAICKDKKVALKLQLIRNHGEVIVSDMGLKNKSDLYNTVGLNFRMTEMEAAVASCQLSKLDVLNAKRIKLANYLTNELNNIDGIEPPKVFNNYTHVYYFYPIKFNEKVLGLSRDKFAEAMSAEGFNLRPGYVKPIYLEPMYQKKICFGMKGFPFHLNENVSYKKGICPNVERLQKSELLITNIIYPPLTCKDMQLFIDAIHKVLKNKDYLINV